MFLLLSVILCITIPQLESYPDYPVEYPIWPEWVFAQTYPDLINMTAEFIKDATYKLRHAEKIKKMYSGSITFELGFIAAGIQERFVKMLELYKKYADYETFQKDHDPYTMVERIYAYHVIQGYYNEIRLEISMFHDIVKKHETSPTTRRWFKIPTMGSKGKKRPEEQAPIHFDKLKAKVKGEIPGAALRQFKRPVMTWRPRKLDVFYKLR